MTQALALRPGLGQADLTDPSTIAKLAVGGFMVAVGLYEAFRSRGPIALVTGEGQKEERFELVPHSDFIDVMASAAAVGGGAYIIADAFGIGLLGGGRA